MAQDIGDEVCRETLVAGNCSGMLSFTRYTIKTTATTCTSAEAVECVARVQLHYSDRLAIRHFTNYTRPVAHNRVPEVQRRHQ
jgi:hypothetical protein